MSNSLLNLSFKRSVVSPWSFLFPQCQVFAAKSGVLFITPLCSPAPLALTPSVFREGSMQCFQAARVLASSSFLGSWLPHEVAGFAPEAFPALCFQHPFPPSLHPRFPPASTPEHSVLLGYGEVKLGTVFAFCFPDNTSGFTGSFLRATGSRQGPEGDELLLFTLPYMSFSPWFSSQPVGRLMAGL